MREAEKWTVKIKQDFLTNPLLFELWNMLLNRIKSRDAHFSGFEFPVEKREK